MQRATLLTRANNPFIFYATECPTGRVPAGGGPAATARGDTDAGNPCGFLCGFFFDVKLQNLKLPAQTSV